MIATQEHSPQISSHWLAHITVADGLMLIVLLVTAVIRLTNLDAQPLSPSEAENALHVWQAWQPVEMTAAASGHSPAYFSFTSIISQILGNSDITMRLIPALFGIATVALPWFLRKQIGAIGALVMSLFLAISPLQMVIGRTVSGEAIGLFSLLLIAVAWMQWQENGDSRWLITLAVAIGLGVASTALFYSGLLAFLISIALQKRVEIPTEETNLSNDGLDWKRPVLIGTAVFLAVSTLFLWHLQGLGMAASLFGDWLSRFNFTTDIIIILNPILALGRYELLLFISGALLLAWALMTNEKTAVIASFWFVAIFGLILLQHGNLQNTILLTLPGYFLLGKMTNELWESGRSRVSWYLTIGLIVAGALIWANVARYGRVITSSPDQLGYLWIAIVTLALALASIFFVARQFDSRTALQGTLLSLLVVAFIYYWGTGWWLAHHAQNDPRERWVMTPTTDDDIRIFSETLDKVAQQTANSHFDLEIFSAVDSPVLRWYLRQYNQAQFGDTIPNNATHDAIITRTDQTQFTLGSNYFGADFTLARSDIQLNPSQSAVLDTLRWWLFHQSNTTVFEDDIIVWIRSDVTE